MLSTPERLTQRFNLSVPAVILPGKHHMDGGPSATSINISELGAFLNTKHPVFVGLPVGVLE